MKISEIMSHPVVTVEPDDSLVIVSDIFNNTRFHHLLVVEKGVLIGVVSDRDWLKAISPNIGTASEQQKDLATLNKRVHQIMTRQPITLTLQNSIHEVIDIFAEQNISCIPVVNKSNQPIGIISWRDIIRAIKVHNKK
ncbi:CBS domain-containing protein [Catenovulum sp. 2E275]|uniref:CBS domain-containing protein n=1 Tax=Catenovulum sp. 2E275 TaxID=2980497 RepID=UPI0021D198A4|nr:CBS domain-containing protein [Catenovulum sp. 2E275]MCU4675713.1 CBS domain-containing protein [Catenovulum sp. 2E275]